MLTETTKRTADKITAEIIEYFREHEEVFDEAIEELDNYNGWLGDDRCIPMDEFNEIFWNTKPSDIAARIFYGYSDVYGHSSEFNPNCEYFYFNGYGNLVSTDTKDYSAYIDKYVIESMAENRNSIYAIDDYDELSELFDELEKAEKEA